MDDLCETCSKNVFRVPERVDTSKEIQQDKKKKKEYVQVHYKMY